MNIIRLSGTLANRPSASASISARYYATDEEKVYVALGNNWLPKTSLDEDQAAGQISGDVLVDRPDPNTCIGFVFTDATTGDQYEAFPDAWALIGDLTPSAGGGVVDGQQLFDGDHVLSLDAGSRKIYASDGTTEMLDWVSPTSGTFSLGRINIFGGKASFDSSDGSVFGAALLVDQVRNNYGESAANIDLQNRKLYNPDGTTVAIDYGTNGQIKLPNLPTSDPAVAGQLWNDAGVVKISAG